jgi:vacuolar protein sorting-associated protein 35
MDCIIQVLVFPSCTLSSPQVFPDEYHLQTLHSFLESCGRLSGQVNIKSIIISLMDRLVLYRHSCSHTQAAFAMQNNENVPQEIQLFDIFSEQIANIGKARVDMPLEDTIALHVALVNLALKVYVTKMDYVDKVSCILFVSDYSCRCCRTHRNYLRCAA